MFSKIVLNKQKTFLNFAIKLPMLKSKIFPEVPFSKISGFPINKTYSCFGQPRPQRIFSL